MLQEKYIIDIIFNYIYRKIVTKTKREQIYDAYQIASTYQSSGWAGLSPAQPSPAQPMGQLFFFKKPWDGLGRENFFMGIHGPKGLTHGLDVTDLYHE